MPNTFAYLVLFSWPLVAVGLFRLLPLQKALVWTLIGGHLLLPSETYVNLPLLPVMDRTLVTSMSALILCAIYAPKVDYVRDLTARTGRTVIVALFALIVVGVFMTVLQNSQPIINGRVHLPGLRIYDAYSLISLNLFQMIPLWLGLRYLNNREGHKILLEVIAIAGVIYTLPALLEIRISPQLHRWVYGFFPQDFIQHIRDGGFRPLVFLNHGLMLGIFFCMSIISSVVLYREARREGRKAAHWMAAAIWLVLVLYLSKTLGAFVLGLIFAASAFLFSRRIQAMIAVTVACIVLFYPALRGAGWIPVDTVYAWAKSVSDDRANSLKFRLDNEDNLLARANERPWVGWGSWGRNSIFDPETGRMTSVTDGIWLIFIGVYGWLGYIGRFGLLTLPLLFMALRQKKLGQSFITPGLSMVLCATLVDLLPNAGLVNYVWLMAGAIAGSVLWQRRDGGETIGQVQVAAPARASWLMAEEVAPAARRQGRSVRPQGRLR